MEDEELLSTQEGFSLARQGYLNNQNQELNSLMAKLTDPESDIYEIELALKGIQIDSEGKPKQVYKALMNDEGVGKMLAITKSIVSPVTYMSNLTEEQIDRMIIELALHVVSDLAKHKHKYNIDTYEDCTRIRNIVCNKMLTSLHSARENGMRRMLRSTILETNVSTQGSSSPQKKQGGGLGSLFSFKK